MKLSRLMIILPVLVSGAMTTAARDVDLLHFEATNPAAKALVPQSDTPDRSEGVMPSMREHFVFNLQSLKASLPPIVETGPAWLPSKGINASTMLMPPSASGGATCENAAYAPTWWLSRAAEQRRALHFSTVAKIACEHGLPSRLLDAVIAQESGYNPWVISSAGAMGMMQIMPGTARVLGLATPFDPIANMRAGARYLRQQLDRFGRVDLALAAYNAGPERRSLAKGYIPAIPETLSYVRTITTNWARLAELGGYDDGASTRTIAAMTAVRETGYREVELVRYDGSNAANPM